MSNKDDLLVLGINKWKRSTQIDAFVSIYNSNDERKLAQRMVGMFSDHEVERFIELLQAEMEKGQRFRARLASRRQKAAA